MPVDAKPLFRPDALRPHLLAFPWPDNMDEVRRTINKWAEMFRSQRADKFKEKELLPRFLTDILGTVLGYTEPADDAERFTFSRERHVEVDGKFADAVLGHFRPDGFTSVVALEGKGPLDPLDRPFAGRKESAVKQGYGYAINLQCDWIIVTSMKQTRLYYKGTDQNTYERFDTIQLATDDALLKRFLFLLGAARVTPVTGSNHLTTLFNASEKAGKELTKAFYFEYAEMRQTAFEHLCRENPTVAQGELLTATQKLLDRILFCAFCEDRGLLPAETIKDAYEHRDRYHPKPIWENFRGLFRAIDKGNSSLNIPEYNGGLFAEDPVLDSLVLTDEVCTHFKNLGTYDYRSPGAVSLEGETEGKLVDVEILGHIFEQSITDLERLRNELDGKVEPLARDKLTSRRKKEGAFYTPAFITRYIVEQALGSVLRDRFEAFRAERQAKAKGTAKAALADPKVYDLAKLKEPQRKALIEFWEDWQGELAKVRILDPACGSGAFLIEAFDQLHTVYDETNERLQELRGSRSLFDPDARILQSNLYGVDLNEEAIEICRLSLWIKTAARGKKLTSLDHTIRVGNSVVSDPAVHPRAFDWQTAFPEVFKAGGFDVIIGNPPYVRQELLSPIKPYLQAEYRSFHGMADLYVYFYELGCRHLKPGGRMSYIVTNKWMKAGYGEPLRKFFAESAWTESVVDFGHAKQIFEDADVFPCIVVIRKPTEEPQPKTVRVCSIPRETLRVDDLSNQIESEGIDIEASNLSLDGWQLEPVGVSNLLLKIRENGVPLNTFSGVKPFYGVKTGLNEAFLIDSAIRASLIAADPKCESIIKPYLRGQDIERWSPNWSGAWMIFVRRGLNIEDYPSVHEHLKAYRMHLEPKPRDWKGDSWPGRKSGTYRWFEIQDPVEYWELLEQPKIIYPEITWRQQWTIDLDGLYSNNTVYFIPSSDTWIVATMNSPVAWWFVWRAFAHGKDEAIRFFTAYVEGYPVPEPTTEQRLKCDVAVSRLIEISNLQQGTRKTLLDWFKVEYGIEKPSLKLQDPISLDSDALVDEIKKLRGKKNPLSAAALKALRDEDARTLEPARRLQAEALALENQLSDLVNAAYGLTPAEVKLMWDTAPPRMPIPRPAGV